MKAVLVLDKMPEKCILCPLFDINYDYDEPSMCEPEMRGVIPKSKPDWCPLKELPEAKDIPFDDGWYQRGWNDCLDAIENGEEE